MKRIILFSLLCLACSPALAGDRWRMITYECETIDADAAGFTCQLRGGAQVTLVLNYTNIELQKTSKKARYLRLWYIYRWFDNGGIFFEEIVPGQNRRRVCSKPKRSIEYFCHEWLPIDRT